MKFLALLGFFLIGILAVIHAVNHKDGQKNATQRLGRGIHGDPPFVTLPLGMFGHNGTKSRIARTSIQVKQKSAPLGELLSGAEPAASDPRDGSGH